MGISAFLLAFEYKNEETKDKTKLIEGQNEEENIIEDKKEKESENKEEEKEEGKKEIKIKKQISVKELFRLFRTKKYLMILSFCICGLCK